MLRSTRPPCPRNMRMGEVLKCLQTSAVEFAHKRRDVESTSELSGWHIVHKTTRRGVSTRNRWIGRGGQWASRAVVWNPTGNGSGEDRPRRFGTGSVAAGDRPRQNAIAGAQVFRRRARDAREPADGELGREARPLCNAWSARRGEADSSGYGTTRHSAPVLAVPFD